MCNKGIEGASVLELQPEVAGNQELQEHQAVQQMDGPVVAPTSAPSSNDDKPRVKFLCSFAGSILPRPHDGKLRYVGGETRIMSLPRDITYNELMAKMMELFDGAMVLKYQQPDEDLDALVSVVNDDDVTNMMEEYEKLGAGDGFTRLRIFLFSCSDQDGSMHFVGGDERDNERRYVDALNSLSDSPNSRWNQTSESQFFSPADNGHVALVEQFFNQMNLEGGLHNQRNPDIHMPPVNLGQLTIPPLVSVQTFSQLDSPWSPAYYSPRQPSVVEQRQVAEYPTSPSSGRYRAQYAELPDKNFDGIPEEYNRNQPNQFLYEHQPQFTDTTSIFPTAIPSEKSGFPGNILQGTNAFEGNSICNNCRMTFQRNHTYPESLWQHGDHPPTEAHTLGNGYHHVGIPCAECPPNRDMFILNADTSIHHPYYPGEQNDHRPGFNGNSNRERGGMLQNQLTPRTEESRSHVSGSGRISDHYVADNNMISRLQFGVPDPRYVPLHPVHRDESRFIRGGPEIGSQVFHDPAGAAGSNMHIQPMEERVMRYATPSYAIKADGVYQVAHGHGPAPAPAHAMWRNGQSPMHGGTSYEVSGSPHLTNSLINPGYTCVEGSQRLQTGLENQNPWVSSPKPLVSDSTSVVERVDGETHQLPIAYKHGNGFLDRVDSVQSPSNILNIAAPLDPLITSNTFALVDDKLALPATPGAEPGRLIVSGPLGHTQATFEEKLEASGLGFVCVDQNMASGLVGIQESDSTCVLVARNSGLKKAGKSDASTPVAVGCVNDVKSGHEANGERDGEPNEAVKEEHQNDCHGDLEIGADSEKSHESKIELTKAEEEALSRGLQTIRNEDLEEIRELGTGTYGAVYHGKWKGSDVAIKRIKASCFAGRPTERERLISDFWKEAQILGSLHHPNVVSFYGVVRDGPDGSLATVTEFMVNGSLKQFLQKKDRTIDRRKRLMIAMDAAFGMEYLHGKSIVHFDLKCENLLVNMRDPNRPVCKIGDLGLSKVKQHTLVSGGVRGTLPWMAPELLSGKSNMVTEKVDVYSFGVVMWELLTGDEPYKDMHCASIIGGIVNNTLRPTIPTWCDPEWKSLMESCWDADPALRPSFSEISQKLRSMAAAMNLK